MSDHASADRMVKVVARARRSGALPAAPHPWEHSADGILLAPIDQRLQTSDDTAAHESDGLAWLNDLLLQDSPRDQGHVGDGGLGRPIHADSPPQVQGDNDLTWLLEPDLMADFAQWSSS